MTITPTRTNHEMSFEEVHQYLTGAAEDPTVPVPRQGLQALEILLKQFFNDPAHFLSIERSFFSKADPDAEVVLGTEKISSTLLLPHVCTSGSPKFRARILPCVMCECLFYNFGSNGADIRTECSL